MPKPKNRKFTEEQKLAKRARREARLLEQLSETNPTVERYAPSQWMPQNAGAEVDLLVPSGQLCRVRTLGLQHMMRAGALPHIDSLSQVVASTFIKEDGSVDVNALASDDQEVDNLFDVINRIVIEAVIAPVLHPVPLSGTGQKVGPVSELREEGLVYIDTVPEEDQMFIFQFVLGGVSDLEQFREQTAELLDGVVTVEADGVPAE